MLELFSLMTLLILNTVKDQAGRIVEENGVARKKLSYGSQAGFPHRQGTAIDATASIRPAKATSDDI